MAKKIVIIGAVALGPKVACRLRRLDPDAEITLIDRDHLISYGGCGIPYYVGGDIADIEDLYSTSAHVKRDIPFFENCKGIRVITGVEATSIDRTNRCIVARNLDTGLKMTVDYDKLVLATGATPIRPSFPGSNLPCVFCIADLHNAKTVKELLSQGKVSNCVVIGAGSIGIEISEAMTDLWGISTTLIEMEDQVLPTLLGKCIARVTKNHLEEHGVTVLLDQKVESIQVDKESGSYLVETNQKTLPADIVILATGVKPQTTLAKEAGLALGNSGGLLVDRRMRTNDPDIYAGGDCVELRNLISGENICMPLGSLANRQGRIIAHNIHGGCSNFDGTVGTYCIKVFDLGVSKAGLTYRQAKETGFDPVYSVVAQADHAHFYPNAELLYIALIGDRKTRRILGIEAAGKHGDAVKARVDSVAALLRHHVSVDDICNLETGYAPPFGSAMDVINNAGNCLDNILSGTNTPVDVNDFIDEFRNRRTLVVDIRGAREALPYIKQYQHQWLNIPQEELRRRYSEIPTDEPVFLICDTGPRSYEAQVFLATKGFVQTRNIQGGLAMVRMTDPTFIAHST